MEGWNLNEKNYLNDFISDDRIWEIFNIIFSSKSKNRTTYKFAFMKSLIESLDDVDEKCEIKLSYIFGKFSRIYWRLIVENNFDQIIKIKTTEISAIDLIFNKYIGVYDKLKFLRYEEIDQEIKVKIENDVFMAGKKYVVGAIYGDSQGYMYSFSKNNNLIKFNPLFLAFMKKHNEVLLKLNYIEWAYFLEKVNEEEKCYKILHKLYST